MIGDAAIGLGALAGGLVALKLALNPLLLALAAAGLISVGINQSEKYLNPMSPGYNHPDPSHGTNKLIKKVRPDRTLENNLWKTILGTYDDAFGLD